MSRFDLPTPPDISRVHLREVHERNNNMLQERFISAIIASYDSILMGDILGLSFDELTQLAKEGKISSFKCGDSTRYPNWQVSDGKIREGVKEIITAFPYDGISLHDFMTSKNSYLGIVPISGLSSGETKLEDISEAINLLGPNYM